MELKKIKISFSDFLSSNGKEYLSSVFDNFPLKGKANYETEMVGNISNIKSSVGEKIILSPKCLQSRLRCNFDLGNLPSEKYKVEYLFGDEDTFPILFVTELNSKEVIFPVKRTFEIYSVPMK